MTALGSRIAKLIETQGPLSIAQFMTIALHDPQQGYYATHHPIGVKGDFITAPEISQIFGELIGLWCVQVWRDQDCPPNARLVELGPGRGTLMADALKAARVAPEFAERVELELVESSAPLRMVQQRSLSGCAVPVRWSDHFETGNRPLLLIANEFFDALPIRQYVHTERGWCERMVVSQDKKLSFALSPTPSLIHTSRAAPLGSVIESAPAAIALAEEIGRSIAQSGGGALIIDYGYDRPGLGETLQGVGAHRFEGVLNNPGAIDISAHVDFSSLAAAASSAGADTFGPIDQGTFLERVGIRTRAEALARQNPSEAHDIALAVGRLTDPVQMGRLFKVLAIMPPNTPKPPGF